MWAGNWNCLEGEIQLQNIFLKVNSKSLYFKKNPKAKRWEVNKETPQISCKMQGKKPNIHLCPLTVAGFEQ